VPIIDCYTLLGVWPQAEVELSVEALAAGMQARQVTRSLVTHTTAIFYDSVLGNDETFQLCSQYEPLHPVAVINPLQYPRALDEIQRCLARGVQVFRFCPREHGYPFSGSVGPLREALRALERAKLLLVDVAGMPAPVVSADVEDLLPCPTAISVDSDGLGTAIHAGRQGSNLWIETSALEGGGTIEAAVKYLGAKRVVFGSQAPLRSIGGVVMSVQYAEVSDEDRAAIFEGNVQRALA
jgi:uncharacterized protein